MDWISKLHMSHLHDEGKDDDVISFFIDFVKNNDVDDQAMDMFINIIMIDTDTINKLVCIKDFILSYDDNNLSFSSKLRLNMIKAMLEVKK